MAGDLVRRPLFGGLAHLSAEQRVRWVSMLLSDGQRIEKAAQPGAALSETEALTAVARGWRLEVVS